MAGGQRAVMSCIHSLKHIKRLCTSALAHYYPVRPQYKKVNVK
jgi:hypothetical protein